jgi:serine/threonine-protein kinase
MSDLEARPVPGTENRGVNNPIFSPDGRWLVFYSQSDATLKKIAVTGGGAITLCQADNPFGMSWDQDTIIFGQGSKGIMRVSSNGGSPTVVVRVKDSEVAHGPQLLPGGQHVLFTVTTGTASDRWDRAQIVAQSLKSGDRKTLVEGGSDGRYLPSGHIVYALSGSLLAVPFDVRRLEIKGGPTPVLEGVSRSVNPTNTQTGTAQFSVSSTGSLVYLPGPVQATGGAQRILVEVDRNGQVVPLKLAPGPYSYPRVSPDGKQAVVDTDDGIDAAVWIYDLSGATAIRRLTFGGRNRFPIWSSDGQRVAFQSDRDGDRAIFWQRADGTGTAERLTKPEVGTEHVPDSWSPKGDRFLFSVTTGSESGLWTFALQDRKAELFGGVQASKVLIRSDFSPDGQWVAYAFAEGVHPQVFVQPFPSTGAKYQVPNVALRSANALWSPNGKELFFATPGQLFVVSVVTQPSFTFGNPLKLPARIQVGDPTTPRPYDITPDGKILGVVAPVNSESGMPATPLIQVVLNWTEELKQRVPTR